LLLEVLDTPLWFLVEPDHGAENRDSATVCLLQYAYYSMLTKVEKEVAFQSHSLSFICCPNYMN
jgi:hypothetical protein